MSAAVPKETRTCLRSFGHSAFEGHDLAKRAKSAEFRVFPAEGGYRVLQRASSRDGELMEALGVWRREYCTATGALLGFRVVGMEKNRVDSDLKTIHTTASISRNEMEVNAGLHGRSRTFGLREMARLERTLNGEPPEDAVERTRAKVAVYPLIGAARGEILAVWPR